MTSSSAASERNFSTIGFVHSKLRNSLKGKPCKQACFYQNQYSIVLWRPNFYRLEDSEDEDVIQDDAIDDNNDAYLVDSPTSSVF